ncbi:MAG: ATP-binding cassette domain-containing protein, partial [Solirubrobacteraceae bacterium]
MTAALAVEDVRVTFRRRDQGPVVAVDGVSLSVPAAGAVGLVGESGCGKSTLARVITGIPEARPGRSATRRGDPAPAA